MALIRVTSSATSVDSPLHDVSLDVDSFVRALAFVVFFSLLQHPTHASQADPLENMAESMKSSADDLRTQVQNAKSSKTPRGHSNQCTPFETPVSRVRTTTFASDSALQTTGHTVLWHTPRDRLSPMRLDMDGTPSTSSTQTSASSCSQSDNDQHPMSTSKPARRSITDNASSPANRSPTESDPASGSFASLQTVPSSPSVPPHSSPSSAAGPTPSSMCAPVSDGDGLSAVPPIVGSASASTPTGVTNGKATADTKIPAVIGTPLFQNGEGVKESNISLLLCGLNSPLPLEDAPFLGEDGSSLADTHDEYKSVQRLMLSAMEHVDLTTRGKVGRALEFSEKKKLALRGKARQTFTGACQLNGTSMVLSGSKRAEDVHSTLRPSSDDGSCSKMPKPSARSKLISEAQELGNELLGAEIGNPVELLYDECEAVISASLSREAENPASLIGNEVKETSWTSDGTPVCEMHAPVLTPQSARSQRAVSSLDDNIQRNKDKMPSDRITSVLASFQDAGLPCKLDDAGLPPFRIPSAGRKGSSSPVFLASDGSAHLGCEADVFVGGAEENQVPRNSCFAATAMRPPQGKADIIEDSAVCTKLEDGIGGSALTADNSHTISSNTSDAVLKKCEDVITRDTTATDNVSSLSTTALGEIPTDVENGFKSHGPDWDATLAPADIPRSASSPLDSDEVRGTVSGSSTDAQPCVMPEKCLSDHISDVAVATSTSTKEVPSAGNNTVPPCHPPVGNDAAPQPIAVIEDKRDPAPITTDSTGVRTPSDDLQAMVNSTTDCDLSPTTSLAEETGVTCVDNAEEEAPGALNGEDKLNVGKDVGDSIETIDITSDEYSAENSQARSADMGHAKIDDNVDFEVWVDGKELFPTKEEAPGEPGEVFAEVEAHGVEHNSTPILVEASLEIVILDDCDTAYDKQSDSSVHDPHPSSLENDSLNSNQLAPVGSRILRSGQKRPVAGMRACLDSVGAPITNVEDCATYDAMPNKDEIPKCVAEVSNSQARNGLTTCDDDIFPVEADNFGKASGARQEVCEQPSESLVEALDDIQVVEGAVEDKDMPALDKSIALEEVNDGELFAAVLAVAKDEDSASNGSESQSVGGSANELVVNVETSNSESENAEKYAVHQSHGVAEEKQHARNTDKGSNNLLHTIGFKADVPPQTPERLHTPIERSGDLAATCDTTRAVLTRSPCDLESPPSSLSGESPESPMLASEGNMRCKRSSRMRRLINFSSFGDEAEECASDGSSLYCNEMVNFSTGNCADIDVEETRVEDDVELSDIEKFEETCEEKGPPRELGAGNSPTKETQSAVDEGGGSKGTGVQSRRKFPTVEEIENNFGPAANGGVLVGSERRGSQVDMCVILSEAFPEATGGLEDNSTKDDAAYRAGCDGHAAGDSTDLRTDAAPVGEDGAHSGGKAFGEDVEGNDKGGEDDIIELDVSDGEESVRSADLSPAAFAGMVRKARSSGIRTRVTRRGKDDGGESPRSQTELLEKIELRLKEVHYVMLRTMDYSRRRFEAVEVRSRQQWNGVGERRGGLTKVGLRVVGRLVVALLLVVAGSAVVALRADVPRAHRTYLV